MFSLLKKAGLSTFNHLHVSTPFKYTTPLSFYPCNPIRAFLPSQFVRNIFIPLNQIDKCNDNNSDGDDVIEHVDNYNCKKKEITVYIKGFLGKGEDAEHFGNWFKSHQHLSNGDHGWGPLAHGYYWKAGQTNWDNYIPFGTLLYSAGNLLTRRRIPFSPAGVAVLAASEVAIVGARIWFEFRKAHEMAHDHAPTLAQHLADLSSKYDRVRCVAHSLGCVLLLESVKGLPADIRPHEVHLLAPALHEEKLLHNIAQEGAYLYHCSRDLVLNAASVLNFLKGEPVGLAGPKQKWEGLLPIDVSDHLGYFVHGEYKEALHKIAVDHKLFKTLD